MVRRQRIGMTKFYRSGKNRFYFLIRRRGREVAVRVTREKWFASLRKSDAMRAENVGSYWWRINRNYEAAQRMGLPYTKRDIIRMNTLLRDKNFRKRNGLKTIREGWQMFGFKPTYES